MLLSLLRALLGIFGLSRGAPTAPPGGGATPGPGTGGATPSPGTGGGTPSTIPPPPNQPPRIRWTSAIASPSGVPVPLRYTLEDDESDPVRIEVQYSLDGGTTFIPATEDDAVASDGTAALSSDPGGVDHVFAWHAKQDLDGRAATGVIVQVKTFDANPGATITSAPFDVDARVIAMPSRPWVNPFRPYLTGQNVPVRFVVGDRDSQPVRVLVEYRLGTGGWMPATPSLASDQMDPLPAPDVEADYRFIWNAGQDLPNQTGSVALRFTALKGNLAGPATATPAFSLDTTVPVPAASAFTPPPARTPTITIVSTNPIEGVRGRLLPEVLRVRVVDSSGQPVAGMRVSFTQAAGSIPLEFESDRDVWEVTDGFGEAGIRVRPGAVGAGEVVVQLPGFPGHKKSLSINSKAPVIYHNNLPATRLIHGQPYSITVGYGDPNTTLWMAEGFDPLRLKVEGTNALVSHAVLPIPEKPDYTGTARVLTFVPLYDEALGGGAPGGSTMVATPGKLRVSDLADPTVFVDIPFTVASPTSNRRTGRFTHAQYPTRLVPNAGVPGTQVGYPGLTLKQTFRVHLTDGAHVFQGAQNNFTGCNVTPPPITLNVEWAAHGLLSTQSTPPATATNRLRTTIDTPVHFTPAGEGPWHVTVSVSDSVIDPHPVRITYMSGTTPVCERDNAFGVNSSFSFIVQEPTDVKVMPTQAPVAGAPAPTALDAIRPGEPWHVEIGLSECEPGGQPADLRVTSALHRGASIPAYSGYPYSFDQPLAVTLNATRNGLTSASLTAVQGEPATVVAGAHAVIPGAWLRIHGSAVEHSLPVPGRPHRRLVTEGAESLEETPAGTSSAAGAFNSVLLHNGEFVYRAHCIGMADRPRLLSISRTHRSHARTDGPLGPGWELEHCGGLDVSRSRGVRWFNGLGRTIDFPSRVPPPGVFVELRSNLAISADQSPFEIKDAHGNVMHFHVDGSPRFLKDLNDNRTRYEYNAQGQLTAIKGAWHNRFTLTYWKKGDPVDKEVYGRLRSIVDHIGREVNFEYYPAGSTTDGLPGWLKTVDHASPQVGQTLVDGHPVGNFRAPETYLYEINPNDPLEARVRQVLDWNLDVRLENKYDAFRRVEKQTTDERGDYTFGYATTPRATTFGDRKRRTTRFEFADTPYANAAAPSKITARRDAALHPGKPDLVTTLMHRPWGARASIAHAAGIVEEFWYDEASPYPRSRGNLLKHRVRDASGAAARLQAFEYDDRFNVVNRVYSPRAFAAGENPQAYLTSYSHDSKGRLTRIVSPRTLHGVIEPVGARRRVLWIDDEPSQAYSYNDFGLLKEHIDEQGVVTEYQYWDAANPYGQQISGPTAPDAGGMLAKVTRDTRQTADRSVYLPGVAPASMQSMLFYGPIGDLFATIDPLGARTLTPQNGLHQVYEVEQIAALANTERRYQMWDEFGNLAQIEITLPQAPGRPAGKLTDKTFWNRTERKWEHHVAFQPFAAGGGAAPPPAVFKETLEVDDDDQPTAFFDAEASAAATPAASLVLACDERGLLAEVRAGGTATAATKLHADAAGDVGEVTLPGNRTLAALRSPLAEPAGLVEADGLRHELLHDEGGMPTRQVTRAHVASGTTTSTTPPKTLGFSEEKVDEWNRSRRTNFGYFETDAAAGAQPPVPEYFPSASMPWPPPAGAGALADGAWGPGDGRATYDTLFDASGRMVRACDDDLGMSWTRYDAHGRPIEWSDSRDEFDPFFNITTAAYDMTARTVERTHHVHSSDRTQPRAQSFLEREDLDGLGRTVRTLNGAGDAVRFVYDERDQVVEIYDAAGRDSAEMYNGAPVNERGNLTRFEYDEAGRVIQIETSLTEGGLGGRPPENNPYNLTQKTRVFFNYDRAGRFVGHTDWLGRPTTRRYDALGRLWQISYSPSAATGGGPANHTMTFDAQSRIDTATDANGTRIKLEYDALNRISERRVEASSTPHGAQRLRSEYDDAGLLHVAEQYPSLQPGTAASWRSVFTYDSAGHVLTATENGRAIVSEYAGNRRRVLRYPGGAVVRFEYDVNGRLRSVDDNGAVLTLHYLGEFMPDSWSFNGVAARYAYDSAARVESITISGLAQGALRFGLEYTDRTGRICVRTRQLGAGATETRLYFYDSAGRLTRDNAQPFPASAHANTQMRLWLDGDGVVRKRETKFIGGPATPDRVDEFEREERGRVIRKNGSPLIHDKNGNLLNDGVQQYVYDAFDRLIVVLRGGIPVCIYEYDALHRLVKRTAGNVVHEYVYDSSNLIEIRSGSQVDRFVYADEDSRLLLAEIGGQRYLVITSPEGSVDSLVDAQRGIVESYEYSAKGDVTRLDAARQPLAGTPLCPFLHKQQLFDPASGLIHYHLRWYSPELGVFLTPDPAGIAQGTNAYTLCQGDPINGLDPTGGINLWDAATEGWDIPRWGDITATFSLRNFSVWQGLKGGAGAVKALGVAALQLGLTAWDVGTHIGASIGGYRFKSVSALGQLYDSSPTLGDFFWAAGKGIVQTPLRMLQAGAQGNAVGFGEEAMNLYILGRGKKLARRLDQGVGVLGRGFNRFVGARTSPFGVFARNVIRNAQVQIARVQATLAMLNNWRNPLPLWRGKWRYRQQSLNPADYAENIAGDVFIYEKSFNPPPNWAQAVEVAGIFDQLGPELADALREQGFSARSGAVHEGFHSYQRATAPQWWEARVGNKPFYLYDAAEFTQAGAPFPGAWNFHVANPPMPAWKAAIPITGMSIGARRRR